MLRNYCIIPILALVLANSQAIAQDGVLGLHNNGLLYSDAVIAQLRLTVDSLHERFRNLETGAHTYYGLPLASAHVVRLRGADLGAALADMEAGLAFEDFLKRYPQAEVEEGQLVLQQRQHGGGAIFRQVLALDYGLQISAPVYRPAQAAARTWRGVKSTWKTEISWTSDRESQQDERVEAFFFRRQPPHPPPQHQPLLWRSSPNCPSASGSPSPSSNRCAPPSHDRRRGPGRL